MSSITDLVAAYVGDLHRRGSAPGTIRGSRSHLALFTSYLDGRGITEREKITRAVVQGFQTHLALLEDESGVIRYRASYQGCVFATLRDFFRTLVRLTVVDNDFSAWIEQPRVPRRVTRNIFTVAEMRTFLDICTPATWYEWMVFVLCVTLYGTGIRLGEALRLKLSDVDLDAHLVKIYDSKNRSERLVPFGKVVAEHFKLYLAHVRPVFVRKIPSGLFFASHRGGILDDEEIGINLKEFCERAGIDKKITSHCFRHSYCSHLLAAGCGLRQIAALVGHKSLDVTAGYTRVTGSDLVDLVKTHHPREREHAKASGDLYGT